MYSSTILLVQPDTATGVRSQLEDKGYKVVEAPDTATAMDMVNRSEIALVVTELYLRVGKSRCLARSIRRSPALHRTKVLAYTTHGKRKDRDWARKVGAHGYVITRSGEKRFLEVVDRLMHTPPTPRRAAASPPRTP